MFRNFGNNPLFLNELSKIIGQDWKILGRRLSISDTDLEIIDYNNENIRIKAYEMFTKFLNKRITFDDIRNSLLSEKKIDLVKEIDSFTKNGKLVKDNTCGKLEKDNAISMQPKTRRVSDLHFAIESLLKTAIDTILSFDANDKIIDMGVKIIKSVIDLITCQPNYKKDEDFLKMLRSSYEVIGDTYTFNFNSKFQGNSYKNKTPEKYKIAIDAYEKCLEYNICLRDQFGYSLENILNKLVQKLDKPTNYGYDVTVRDSSKYDQYFNQYVSLNLYVKGKNCLQDKDFENAIYYFKSAIEHPSCVDTLISSYIQVAMILHYYHEKTKQNYNTSVEYYNKAIDIYFETNDENLCASEFTDCLFHLYALLSNPSNYEFISLMADKKQSVKIYNMKEDYIKNKCYLLYIQAKIYACKRFSWMNDRKENLDHAKVLEYCRKALHATDISFVVETKIHYLMAYTYSSLKPEKDLNCYQNAIACCQKALETRLKHNNEGYTERIFTESITLAYSPKTKGFQNITVDNAKPLTDLLEKLYKLNDSKINGFKKMYGSYNSLNIQGIYIIDSFLLTRQNKLYRDILNDKSIANSKEYSDSIKYEMNVFNITKKRLADIKKNYHLYCYYSGFQKTFSYSYHSAILVKKRLVDLKTNSLNTKLDSLIASLISELAAKSQSDDLIRPSFEAEMINAAKNITKLAFNQTQFDNMVMDIIVGIVYENQNLILAKKSQKDAMAWYDEFIKLCKKVNDKIDGKIYGEEYSEDMHKLGHRDAVRIISKLISNGEIYGENNVYSLQSNNLKPIFEQCLKDVVQIETLRLDNVVNESNAPCTSTNTSQLNCSNESDKSKCCFCCCCQ
ncbi:uncharacterized protein LOC105844859 isoform X1 [Hydra vulgaris]|uniref:uncharacterized protein LOC105844859 isoform X1 n=1 Tax=Hydra vulgaris TaxID=6087 RepID=UPI001F5F12CA|nr:uncharacterized protein LOC105844859 [Hydra vulgaris]XP_047146096.1 uncharacterized protein LOC105844859 [Hydra vulgaris]XP_047146097.1 uncharacterized protein LOC105844859 [Hydra vulgaris]XP_047146098.1 uncharacterized protein LOC105844859 [Hydra vulgaris]XP_047146099.1 uncharacterized protein LOC105844859 [Hydra vulgaris]